MTPTFSSSGNVSGGGGGGNHLKMKSNQREYECFQVLYEIVEDTETFGIVGLLHVDQGAYFRGLCDDIDRNISF